SAGELKELTEPATGESLARAAMATEADVDRAVEAAQAALAGDWGKTPGPERSRLLHALADALMANRKELCELEARNVGKAISSVKAEFFSAVENFRFYASAIASIAGRANPVGGSLLYYSLKEPVGVAGQIVPWNYPMMMATWKLSPALAAGCSVVLKPDEATPLTALRMAELAAEVGFPPGTINVVPGPGKPTGSHLVAHPGVDKIAFTGSTAAGMKIASLCGEQLKRYTLELGGKSAAIILDDADVDATLDNLLQVAGLMNNGQACVAQTRVLASRAKYDEVVNGLATRMEAVKVGDPAEMDTEVGPLVAERQRDRVEKYIVQGQEEGAEVVVGGGRPAGQDTGWYVEPTLFAKVTNDMRIAQEEIFGPVISAIAFEDVDDAVAIANDSSYGLSGSVWTADAEAGLDIAKRVRTGTFNVNGFMLEPCAPFGGFKQSGVGREGGPEGLAAYLEDKAINRF
ncbi:MAG TPA: aldehyde dehydrogenase, partial [Acidimicrobiales bacterium]